MITVPYKDHTRLLQIEDLKSIYEILDKHKSIGKLPFSESFDDFTKRMSVNFQDVNTRCIGYFEDGKLITFLIQHVSDKIPAWHMTLLGTISSNAWDYSKNGLDMCWANAMDYAENKKIFRFYWALPKKWARTQSRTILTSTVWPRYEIYTESTVPPNTVPVWPEYKPSFGDKLKPHETIIKLGVLKNEYRNTN